MLIRQHKFTYSLHNNANFVLLIIYTQYAMIKLLYTEVDGMDITVAHVAIYTEDLERSRCFYEKYFNAKSNQKYENTSGFSSYFLKLNDHVSLELMSHTDLEHRDVIDKTNGISHIAFSVGSKENVIALTNQIVADGYNLLSPIRYTGDGYFESCIADPDGNRIRVIQDSSILQ